MQEYLYTTEEVSKIAQSLLASIVLEKKHNRATVVLLQGDLGAGKTTLTQHLGLLLGVEEKMQSPTFGIMKTYSLEKAENLFKQLIHIDTYRLEKPQELLTLGWNDIIKDPQNLVVVEWPELIAEILPDDPIFVSLAHKGEQTRVIRW